MGDKTNPLFRKDPEEIIIEIETERLRDFRKAPIIIRVMKDDEAVIAMVDSNNQRKSISERESSGLQDEI